MLRKSLLVIAIIAITYCAQPATSAPPKCPNESLKENCIQSLFMISSPDKQFPNTTQALDGFCGKLKETDKCIKEYTKKCMTPTGRRATEVAVAGIARVIKRMCKSSEKKKEFVKMAKCGNAVIGDMRSCLTDYKMSLYGAQKVAVGEKLPILCCKFHDFRGCVRKGFDKVGETVCPEQSRMYFAKIADSFQSDVFDLICSQYDDSSDKCKSVVVPVVVPSEDTKSLIKPLRDVLKSVLEDDRN